MNDHFNYFNSIYQKIWMFFGISIESCCLRWWNANICQLKSYFVVWFQIKWKKWLISCQNNCFSRFFWTWYVSFVCLLFEWEFSKVLFNVWITFYDFVHQEYEILIVTAVLWTYYYILIITVRWRSNSLFLSFFLISLSLFKTSNYIEIYPSKNSINRMSSMINEFDAWM